MGPRLPRPPARQSRRRPRHPPRPHHRLRHPVLALHTRPQTPPTGASARVGPSPPRSYGSLLRHADPRAAITPKPTSQVGPLQAVTPGPVQAVTPNRMSAASVAGYAANQASQVSRIRLHTGPAARLRKTKLGSSRDAHRPSVRLDSSKSRSVWVDAPRRMEGECRPQTLGLLTQPARDESRATEDATPHRRRARGQPGGEERHRDRSGERRAAHEECRVEQQRGARVIYGEIDDCFERLVPARFESRGNVSNDRRQQKDEHVAREVIG